MLQKSILSHRRIIVAALSAVAIGLSAPAHAQTEAALREYFEGARVTVKIDMPGTSDGVDVHADASRPIDYRRYGDRLKEFGIAIRAGQSTTVTLVKVKDDLVEFQLGGGGFGTFGDDWGTPVRIPLIEKTQREKDLEKRIRQESDSRRKRRLEGELDEARNARERENRRIQAEREEAEERRKARIAAERLRGGSRFNVRYEAGVPQELRPADLVAALAEYVEFPRQPSRREDVRALEVAPDDVPWKGMMREDAERQFGAPSDVSERREGTLTVVTLIFVRPGQRITAEFVDDVLFRYSIASR